MSSVNLALIYLSISAAFYAVAWRCKHKIVGLPISLVWPVVIILAGMSFMEEVLDKRR